MTKTAEDGKDLSQTKPRSKRLVVACGTVLLPLCLAVGCSGSDATDSSSDTSTASSKTLDTDFVAQAEKACRPYAKYNSSHYFKVTGFNRFAPDAAALDRVGAYMSRNPSYRTLAADLARLGQPNSGKATWNVVMKELSTNQRLMKNEVRAAHQGDVAAFTTYDTRLTDNTAGLHADLVKLGLSQGSACYGVQGDPLETVPVSD